MSKILIFLTDVGSTLIDDEPINNTMEELCGVYRALEKQGHEPYLLLNEGVTSTKYRVVHRDVDVDMFDELLMNREVPNFFGGDFNKHHRFTIDALLKFKGQLSYFFCDPEMAKGNYIDELMRKLYVNRSICSYIGEPTHIDEIQKQFTKSELEDIMGKLSKDNILVRSAYPIASHPIHSRFKNVEFIDSWREHLFYVRRDVFSMFTPDFDGLKKSVCYVGSHKPSRHRRLKELDLFSQEAEDSGLITFYGKIAKFKNTNNTRISISNVNKVYEDHIGSLVIGNVVQNNTGINHRFLQGLLVDRAMLIDSQVDEKRTFMRSDFLNENLYFKDKDEYREKLEFIRNESNFNEVVRLLNKEKEWIMKETVEDFVKRVSA